MSFLARFFYIDTTDPTLKRKGHLLAMFLGLCWFFLLYVFLNNILVMVLFPEFRSEYTLYLVQEIVMVIPFSIFWKMNQAGKVTLTAYLSITSVILVSIFLSDPAFTEYLMVVFALPIGISSFIIYPSSSFLFAALTAIGYLISSILTGYIWQYNLTAVIALFALAFMTWVTARQLENTLKHNDKLVADVRQAYDELKDAYATTLEGWSRALEIRDRETEGHSKRVTELTLHMARHMGFTEDEIIHVYRGVLLHDIGKLGIPDDILRKPGPLTEKETRIMRLHPQIAVDLLSPINYLRPALNIPRYHHEKWDGSGYPHGLMGNSIPLEARIFALVDVYDALSHDRPYRKAWDTQKVLEYIKSESGKHFDPEVVNVFFGEIVKDENRNPAC